MAEIINENDATDPTMAEPTSEVIGTEASVEEDHSSEDKGE